MAWYDFEQISVVPALEEVCETYIENATQKMLTMATQRTLSIAALRVLYTSKIKFMQVSFCEPLLQVIRQFPNLDDVHPFYTDLINVAYDENRYKLALTQLTETICEINEAGDGYVQALESIGTLDECMELQLKALECIAVLAAKQQANFQYLEAVRQYLSQWDESSVSVMYMTQKIFKRTGRYIL